MIKAVIFDADGVLIHREKYFSQRLQDEYGIPLEKTLSFFNGEFVDCLIGKKDLKKVLPKYLQKWGWGDSLEQLLFFWFEKEGLLDKQLVDYIYVLKKQGIKVFVGTNNEKYRTEHLRDKVGVGNIVHKIYGSGHIGFMKPDPEFFQHILKENNLQPDEVLLWDDDRKNVHAAREYGLHAELYTNFKQFKKIIEKYVRLVYS